jgi:nitroreductase
MRPPHDVAHPVHDLIRRRWSARAFADRPVEPEKLRRIFEAARWAPSSFNAQPWSYLVATKDEPADYERMLGCLVEGNQKWAKSAPVLVISVAAHAFEHNGKPNRHAFHDVGAATAFLTIEATALGLFVHQMAGFSPEKVRDAYGVPATAESVAALALGYAGDPASLPDDLRKRELEPGKRKAIEQFVYSGGWGQQPTWLT